MKFTKERWWYPIDRLMLISLRKTAFEVQTFFEVLDEPLFINFYRSAAKLIVDSVDVSVSKYPLDPLFPKEGQHTAGPPTVGIPLRTALPKVSSESLQKCRFLANTFRARAKLASGTGAPIAQSAKIDAFAPGDPGRMKATDASSLRRH
uniref:Uncharacterized protein n=1 Tax=Steinernema glaseri TaxID=37863 RepID=A0A1I7ZZP4_9BILA